MINFKVFGWLKFLPKMIAQVVYVVGCNLGVSARLIEIASRSKTNLSLVPCSVWIASTITSITPQTSCTVKEVKDIY